jgi:hypothetical protein
MDLVSLLCIIRATEWPILFLIRGLFTMIPAFFTVLAVSPIGHVDLPIVLLFL